jgi:hypothetical protein
MLLVRSLIALSLISGTALAGTPDEDPVVADLRARFEAASVPTLEALRPGHSWECLYSRAVRGLFDIGIRSGMLLISPYNGLLLNRGDHRVKTFALTDQGLSGSDGEFTTVLRMTAEGDLIEEYTGTKMERDTVGSVSDPARATLYYGVCPAARVP